MLDTADTGQWILDTQYYRYYILDARYLILDTRY